LVAVVVVVVVVVVVSVFALACGSVDGEGIVVVVNAAGMGIIFDGQLPLPRVTASAHGTAPSEHLIINCAWSGPKVNARHLLTLRRVVDLLHARHSAAGTLPPTLEFRFFTAMIDERIPLSMSVRALERDLLKALSTLRFPGRVAVAVLSSLAIDAYLNISTHAHLALDAYPFGGCNTVMVRRSCVCCCRSVAVALLLSLCCCRSVAVALLLSLRCRLLLALRRCCHRRHV
jgi:hypothetical protein